MRTTILTILLAAAVGSARLAAAATVTGGGPTTSDCYVGYDVTSDNPGFTSDSKSASANACGGSCTFQVSACVGLSEPAGCTATALKAPPKSGTIPAPSSLGPAQACGSASTVTVATKKGGKKKGIKKFKMKATAASAKPKSDLDKLKLTCNPNPTDAGCGTTTTTIPGGGGSCAANPAGGPKELVLTIGQSGTDLDNGWTGSSHNFILVPNGKIDGCLTNCDSSTDTVCDFAAPTGKDTPTGATFGAPLPLLASNTPVCVVSRWADNVIMGTADEATGDISLNVHLISEVYLTDVSSVCPQCKNGKCNSGANSGKACTVSAPQLPVFISQGNTAKYDLSADCPPSLPPSASLKIDFVPLTTGQAGTLQGPIPCNAKPGEPKGVQPPQPDSCAGSGCGAACTGLACVTKIDDPVNPGTQVCVDSKGGVSQLCCNNNTSKPCFTLANNGVVNRAGHPDVPQPALPDTTYPKNMTKGVLASTFCIPSTGQSSIDIVTGLPGPGAIQLTGPAVWNK
jgi:hypothetical protein